MIPTDRVPESLRIECIPVPQTEIPKTRWARWWFSGASEDAQQTSHETRPWYKVIWLTGVDYFSTLGYQPGIALLAAGALSPIATFVLIVVTLFCALPTYAQVAKRSFAGQGSIAMLERLAEGWWAKLFVLVLLGFAVTDFMITITLSAADAALHIVENPLFHSFLEGHQFGITVLFIALLAVVFMKGFKEAIGVAAMIAVPYLALNGVVILRGLFEVVRHPELFSNWSMDLRAHGDWASILGVSMLVFPKLALGLSGFETGVSVMLLVSNGGAPADAYPRARIEATKKLLAVAALIMSVLLLGSSFVTSMLLPAEMYRVGGEASGRALAFLAHTYLGTAFGTVYDFSTILVLGFAGASAMAGLLNLIPRYLPRYGMAPRWVSYHRPLVMVIFVIALLITWAFGADVEAQGGAYATGVLALMLSAAIAVTLAMKKERVRSYGYFGVISLVFAYTFVDNVVERPDGLVISAVFIVSVVLIGGLSRWQRALDLRIDEISLLDSESKTHWPKLLNKKVHLVPLRTSTPEKRAQKAAELRRYYNFKGPILFMHVKLVDDRSEFASKVRFRIRPDGENYLIEVFGAIATANTIAYVSELLKPVSIFIGLTRMNLMTQATRYLLFGEGETGLLVYRILLRYWEWTKEDDVRPLIFLMSE